MLPAMFRPKASSWIRCASSTSGPWSSRRSPVDYCPVTIMPLTEEIVKKYRLGAVDMHIFDSSMKEDRRASSASPRAVLRGIELDREAHRLRTVEVFPQGTLEARDSSIAKRVFLLRLKKVSAFALLAVTIAALFLAGDPRFLKPGGLVPDEIASCIRSQKETALGFARQGISLSTLGTGIDVRSSSSSRE